MVIYKILGLMNGNHLVKILNKDKKKYQKNLKMMKEFGKVISHGITYDSQDLKEYQKLKKVV